MNLKAIKEIEADITSLRAEQRNLFVLLARSYAEIVADGKDVYGDHILAAAAHGSRAAALQARIDGMERALKYLRT